MTNPIQLTPAAIQHIVKEIKKKTGGIGFRLSIKRTGCSGYAYQSDIPTQINEDDICFTLQQDSEQLTLYIARDCLDIINNLTIDYVAEKNNLKQKKLVFINPNEVHRCGCGESFTIE